MKRTPAYHKEFTILGGYTVRWDSETGEQGELVRQSPIDLRAPGDYGADPLGDGTFRMVPSGDVVSLEERNRRLETA